MKPTALVLILLAAPVFAHAASPRTPTADPQRVVAAFVDVCLRAPHAWSTARAAKALGAVPVIDGATGTVAPATPTSSGYAMAIDGVPAQVAVTDTMCELEVDAVDVAATLKRFDAAVAADYSGLRRYDPAQTPPAPPSGDVVRDLHFASAGDTFGVNLRAVATGGPDGQGLVLAQRLVSLATGELKAVDFAASEDLAGRALAPPKYPGAARRACAGGMAVTLVTVDDQGTVRDVVVERTSGRRDLDAAAVEAVRQWRFNPGIRDGVLEGGDVRVPVNFNNPCGR